MITLLLLIDLTIIYLRFVRGYEHLRGFIHGFYFDAEANFPSFYSALTIFFCAVLLWLIGSSQSEKLERRSFYWKLLSLVFIFLSLDEFASLHEYLIQPMNNLVSQSPVKSGYLYFAWFIPYTVLALIMGAVLFRFLFRLPVRTRVLFMVGGLLFLSGALVMEMVGGKYWESKGWAIDGSDQVDLTYALMTTFEELLEMLGILVFIYALSSYYLKDRHDHTYMVRISDNKTA